jgi:hypothetical protein
MAEREVFPQACVAFLGENGGSVRCRPRHGAEEFCVPPLASGTRTIHLPRDAIEDTLESRVE